jgi:hypothetical protein
MEAIVRKIAGLCWALVLLLFCCFAQIATPEDVQVDGGFLLVCGPQYWQFSNKSIEALEKAPPGALIDLIKKSSELNEVRTYFGPS